MAKRDRIVTLPPDVRINPCVAPLSESVSWADEGLGVDEAWKLSQGEGVIVCSLDTGCDVYHPDLDGAILDAKDFTGSRFGFGDRHGHGTHVAGLVGARMGNNVGIRGIAPKCKLLIAKVLGDNGAGSDTSVAQGLLWGHERGARIFCLSLGGASDMPATLAAAKEIVKGGGKFIFAAAGNDGGRVNKPAAYEQCVSVGAYDNHGNLTEFTSKTGRLDIVGPGVEMMSTLPGNRYGTMTGTSQANPVVGAIGALAVAKHDVDKGQSDLVSVADMREHLQKSATDSGRGYKLANARRMLERHGVEVPVVADVWLPKIPLGKNWAVCRRAT